METIAGGSEEKEDLYKNFVTNCNIFIMIFSELIHTDLKPSNAKNKAALLLIKELELALCIVKVVGGSSNGGNICN
jgi:hypothetical protein